MDLEGVVELFGGQLRVLERNGRERDEPIRPRGAERGQTAVLGLDDPARQGLDPRRTTRG